MSQSISTLIKNEVYQLIHSSDRSSDVRIKFPIYHIGHSENQAVNLQSANLLIEQIINLLVQFTKQVANQPTFQFKL